VVEEGFEVLAGLAEEAEEVVVHVLAGAVAQPAAAAGGQVELGCRGASAETGGDPPAVGALDRERLVVVDRHAGAGDRRPRDDPQPLPDAPALDGDVRRGVAVGVEREPDRTDPVAGERHRER